MYEYLDKRYATALYEIAEKNGKVNDCLRDLKEITNIIYNDEGIVQILKNPNISTQRKKKIFTELFNGKIEDEILAFLLILISKGRILYLEEKLAEMEKIHLEKNNILLAYVKTVIPLADSEREAIITKLEYKYKKKILLQEEIDKNIIGGVMIKVGTDIIDGTLKSRLHDIKETAMKSKWR